jgi:para-nitrobenzyl esterase
MPIAKAARPRPVIVYIHGGAYSSGSGSSPLYDGSTLCRRGDVVVVTVNHRLSRFGYLYLPGFPDSGNAGMLDLVLALRWVRDNIASFGGDPDCVTLLGQSGGGAKIATLMAVPAASGLFHRAATMSGQQLTAWVRCMRQAARGRSSTKLGVPSDRAATLASLPAADLLRAPTRAPWILTLAAAVSTWDRCSTSARSRVIRSIRMRRQSALHPHDDRQYPR